MQSNQFIIFNRRKSLNWKIEFELVVKVKGVPAKQNASKETTTASFIVNKGSGGSVLVAENEEEEDTTSPSAAFPTNYNYGTIFIFIS
jgi:hypothetical protein